MLGISNLSQVRVGNLQELVYKQGQAGVTKASVSIVFNNEDPSKSPIGYEQHRQITVTRQIVIGGRNKCARARRCRRRAPPRAAAAAARRRRAAAPRRRCPRARPLRF